MVQSTCSRSLSRKYYEEKLISKISVYGSLCWRFYFLKLVLLKRFYGANGLGSIQSYWKNLDDIFTKNTNVWICDINWDIYRQVLIRVNKIFANNSGCYIFYPSSEWKLSMVMTKCHFCHSSSKLNSLTRIINTVSVLHLKYLKNIFFF